jgi:AcrR family transcriptional regulator
MVRAGLDLDTIVRVAAHLADRDGLSGLTLAHVAAELKVKPSSLYNHIKGLSDLMDELTLLATKELLDRSRESIMGRSGRAALEALANAQRDYAKEHPGLYPITFRSLHGRSKKMDLVADSYLSVFLAVLREQGLDEARALHTVRSLRAAITGFIHLEICGGFGLSIDIDDSFKCLLNMLCLGIDA